jgi:hypothetical protein
MAQKGSPTKGDVKNWEQITDVSVGKIAATTDIANGTFVYQDGANGLKTATSSIAASRVRFCPVGFDNNPTVTPQRELETIKTGAIVVCEAAGAIVVGDGVRISALTAGDVSAMSATTTNLEVSIGRYLGHVGEVEGTGNEPTDAVANDLILVQLV